jgi:hypothetical protein
VQCLHTFAVDEKGLYALAQTIAADDYASNACKSAKHKQAQIVGLVG